jgi:hypothetical protein
MKAWAILEAQRYRAMSAQQRVFKEIIKTTPEFAADLATKYADPKPLWCTACQVYFPIHSNDICQCVFAGNCRLSTYCNDFEGYAGDYPCIGCVTRDVANPKSLRPASEGSCDISSVKAAWGG